jgi:uncharacterized protein
MYYSKYNQIIPLRINPKYSIIHNIFHGYATIVENTFIDRISEAVQNNNLNELSLDDINFLKQRFFLYQSKEEEDYLIINTFELTQPDPTLLNPFRQYMILLTYGCNFKCVYCFQKEHQKNTSIISKNHLLKALEAIEKIEENYKSRVNLNNNDLTNSLKKPLLLIAGGEPLQYTPEHIEIIRSIIVWAKKNNMPYAFVSNGYDLYKYIPILTADPSLLQGIQITLDGVDKVHNRRRPHKNKGNSFNVIVEGIEAALKAGIHIDIRVNVDHENLNCIEDLADIIIKYRWKEKGSITAKLAKVTNHSGVNTNYKWLAKEEDILQTILKKFQENKTLRQIYELQNFRGYHYVETCVKSGKATFPTFHRCEALRQHFVFDPMGGLFFCFEGAGNPKAQIGTYAPCLELFSDRVQQWTGLNTINNMHCKQCPYIFVCAGGCPWYTLQSGKVECDPIKSEINLAWNYFVALANEDILSA